MKKFLVILILLAVGYAFAGEESMEARNFHPDNIINYANPSEQCCTANMVSNLLNDPTAATGHGTGSKGGGEGVTDKAPKGP